MSAKIKQRGMPFLFDRITVMPFSIMDRAPAMPEISAKRGQRVLNWYPSRVFSSL
jgi:hypothetical protein